MSIAIAGPIAVAAMKPAVIRGRKSLKALSPVWFERKAIKERKQRKGR
jgi:hypothetical protein